MEMAERVLVVDDEAQITRVLRTALSAQGYDVRAANDPEEALRLFEEWSPDLIVTDLMMPIMSGVDLCRRVRSKTATPIIVLSVRDQERSKVEALDAGADDYVTKPFKLRELTARLHAVLRRTQIQAATEPKVLEIGNLKIDLNRRLFWRDNEEIHLSPREFDLLAFMMKNAGFPLTHVKLLRTIWGPEYGGELEYLRSYVRMLRKKIESDPENPEYILTEPWLGYRFRDPADAQPR
jgi:two-component system KDP operon response regulator KdpE